MRIFLTVLILMIASSSPSFARSTEYAYRTSTLRGVTINDYGKRPAPSGLLRTWLRIGVVENHLANSDVYIVYTGEDQKLPPIGATCDIVYHLGWIEEYYKPLNKVADRDKVVDAFNCKSERRAEAKLRLS